MAGESPDRSKQRESSAEPTSGSAGPVPGKRDPRLAVARDASPSKPRGSADTATRVLSLPDDTSSPAEGEGGSPEEGDGRLREAVAAWVRTAEPNEDLSGEAGREADKAERDADPEPEPEPDESPRDDTTAEASPPDEDTAPAAGDTPTDTGTVPAARNAAADGEQEAPAADASRDEDPASEAPADKPRDNDTGTAADDDADDDTDTAPAASDASDDEQEAPAADASRDENPASEAPADKDAGKPRDSGPRAAADSDADDDTDTAPAASDASDDEQEAPAADASRDENPASEALADNDVDKPRDSGTDDDAGAIPDARNAADDGEAEGEAAPAAGASRDEDGSEDAVSEAPAVSTADKGVDEPRDSGPRADDDASEAESPDHGDGTDSDPAAAAKPVPDADHAPSAAASEDRDAERAEAGSAPEAESPEREGGTDADADDASSGAASGAGGKAEGPVDQPTGVFRTRRPYVDQPTTMLKLGDAVAQAESESESDTPAGNEAEAEVEAERTSRFVALKDYDDPAARRPAPAAPPAEATTTFPRVGPELTTQQPLPPRPPLDLLAELTNTPPPPQTPLRTAARRVKIWTPLVLLLVIVFAVVQNVRPLPAPTLELTAEDSYTFEGGKPEIPWPADGQAALDVQGIGTFGSSGEQKPVPIASVAKVMTAYLILRDHPLKSGAEGPMIKIDDLAEQQSDAGQESTVNVTAGDEISQREAIESVLIASANNVARLLARWDAESEEAFVEKMNDAAKDLGMTDTTYTDPSGLNDTTVSTAVDQVKLAKEAMKQPAFREVAAMMSYDDYQGVNHSNWNQLVGRNNVVGIKTGTTTSALGNLVFAAKKEVDGETRTVVGAVVRQPAGGKDNTILSAALTAGDELIRAAQGALESATIVKKGEVVGYVDDGLGGRTPVVVTEDVKAVGWAGLSVKLTFAADELPGTATAGTKVGTLTVGDGTSSAVKVPVALQKDLVEPGFTDRLTRLL